jgi:hypothetical protein
MEQGGDFRKLAALDVVENTFLAHARNANPPEAECAAILPKVRAWSTETLRPSAPAVFICNGDKQFRDI